MNSFEISKKASLIFTIFMIVCFSVFTWDMIMTETYNGTRMYTWQSNLIVTLLYVCITFSYYVRRYSFFRKEDVFRFSVMAILGLTFVIVIFILGPLYFLDFFFDIGPGAFGYENAETTIYSITRNIIYHFVTPVFVIYHYLYDKKWRNITTQTKTRYLFPTFAHIGLFFIPFTLIMFNIDGWAPYSIFNPDLWMHGWYSVAFWMVMCSSIFLCFSLLMMKKSRKLEAC